MTQEQIEYIIITLKAIKNMTYKGYTSGEKTAYYLAEEALINLEKTTSSTSS